MNILSAERADAVGQFNLVLAALDVGDAFEFVAPPGLSAVSIYVPERAAILALTRTPAPFFRSGVEATATAHAADVVLLRASDDDEGSPVVAADIALAAPPCAAWVQHDLALWMHEGSLWLVPSGFGPSVAITGDGFSVALVPPFETMAERADGIARAAQAFALPLQPVEAR